MRPLSQPPSATSATHMDVDRVRRASRPRFDDLDDLDARMSTASKKKHCCSSVPTLILVLIIVALLCTAALVIGIYSLVLGLNRKSDDTRIIVLYSSTAATSASTVTPFAGACTSAPSTIYKLSTATPPECLNYTLDADGTRNIRYTASINFCDNVLPFNNATPIWFRFQDAAGIVVANAPIPPNRCGAVATGWYAGQYPAAVFSTATSLACFYQTSNTCSSCTVMSVTNCQTYYVFSLLQPPSCNYRYCTV